MPRGRRRRNSRPTLPFNQKLVLNRWLFSLLGVEGFDQLAEHLRDESLEGLDENNVHKFHHALTLHLPEEQRPQLPDGLLLLYDQNIVSATQQINEKRIARGHRPIVWKYFQYLALLFTEIYLDRYFRNAEDLRLELNNFISEFNQNLSEADRVPLYSGSEDPREQLNKLSFWMATGSGKTLLMHAHILQYRRYLDASRGERGLNRIILITPNEGLSQQHLREFKQSGIDAEIFSKEAPGLFAGRTVEILEVTKLKEESGDKTVAVDAFEGNNLVLVDEGHRGASSGKEGAWMKARDALCERGFSFEYSATFGQAVGGNAELTNEYTKNILFDYSYRWFYGDGFGKDYQILNLENNDNEEWLQEYLVAGLLAFYQQLKLFEEEETKLRPFNIEKPLWIFVGGSVNAVRSVGGKKTSDVINILSFLNTYISDRQKSEQTIEKLLNEGLTTASGKNLFAKHFSYLNLSGLSAADIFEDVLRVVFNAPSGGVLHIENLKGTQGEIALRLGDNEAFGLINVGDAPKLIKLLDKQGFLTGDKEFSDSLFHSLNKNNSTIKILIGSKKFTEGWSSWRVSSMGLMNVGRSEGAQIIQLFGRGVRLKGYNWSLKRSSRVALPPGVKPPKHIRILETLSIFGVRADYMETFRSILNEEGVPDNEERIEFILPIIKNLGRRPLKTIRLKKKIGGMSTEFGDAFRRLGPIPTLALPERGVEHPTNWLVKNPVVLNWYPKVQALASKESGQEAQINEAKLSSKHLALLDIDRLYFELERFKAERGWFNLNITRSGVQELLEDTRWYKLLIPESEMRFDRISKMQTWHEIALALLKKYSERYYKFRKREWELPHLEYRDLAVDDPNFPKANDSQSGYRILIEASQEEIAAKLEALKEAIEKGNLKPWELQGLKAIFFDRHLYQPLLFAEGNTLEITPVPLNKGERKFVEDLKAFCDGNPDLLEGKELYLLRNQSKGRGVGFFEAGNFHPDFILWLFAGDTQHVVFIDPKGLRNVGANDPKIQFYRTIKDLERRLGDPAIVLDSFIVSTTPSHELEPLRGISKKEMLKMHILFSKDDRDTYIRQLLETVLGLNSVGKA